MHAGAGLGQRHPLAAAHEQGQAHALLQQPDLLADGARGHAQGGGGALDAAMAADFRERAQGQQRENRVHHLAQLNIGSRSNRFASQWDPFRISNRKSLQV